MASTFPSKRGLTFATRFAPDCLNKKTISAYGSINAPVTAYGYSERNHMAKTISHWCRNFPNIRVRPWSNWVEHKLLHHQLYGYLPPVFNPNVNYGLKIMEAVALGIPVITGPAKGGKTYITNGYNGLVINNTKEFVRIANRILRSQRTLEALKSNALTRSKEIKNTMPIEYAHAYKQLLK